MSPGHISHPTELDSWGGGGGAAPGTPGSGPALQAAPVSALLPALGGGAPSYWSPTLPGPAALLILASAPTLCLGWRGELGTYSKTSPLETRGYCKVACAKRLSSGSLFLGPNSCPAWNLKSSLDLTGDCRPSVIKKPLPTSGPVGSSPLPQGSGLTVPAGCFASPEHPPLPLLFPLPESQSPRFCPLGAQVGAPMTPPPQGLLQSPQQQQHLSLTELEFSAQTLGPIQTLALPLISCENLTQITGVLSVTQFPPS